MCTSQLIITSIFTSQLINYYINKSYHSFVLHLQHTFLWLATSLARLYIYCCFQECFLTQMLAELRGSGNKGYYINATSNSFIFCFNYEFSFSIVLTYCFKASLVALWNCAILYGATPSKSIDDFHFSDDSLFLVFTFFINIFWDSRL
jgi:hypothetical protein